MRYVDAASNENYVHGLISPAKIGVDLGHLNGFTFSDSLRTFHLMRCERKEIVEEMNFFFIHSLFAKLFTRKDRFTLFLLIIEVIDQSYFN